MPLPESHMMDKRPNSTPPHLAHRPFVLDAAAQRLRSACPAAACDRLSGRCASSHGRLQARATQLYCRTSSPRSAPRAEMALRREMGPERRAVVLVVFAIAVIGECRPGVPGTQRPKQAWHSDRI